MSRQPPRQSSADLQRRLHLALQAHRRGDADAARAGYAAVLKANPRNVDALYLCGVLCTEGGAVDEGIDLLRRALAVDPANAAAHGALAGALLGKGNALQRAQAPAESVECYREAIRRQPVFPEAFSNLSAALRSLRRLEEALASASQALAQRPAYAQALNNRGLILLDGKHGAAAVADFRGALALNPTFAEAWHNLGTALLQLKNYAEARNAFEQLAQIAPQFPHVLGNLLYAQLCDCDWADWGRRSTALVEAVERGANAAMPLAFLCASGSAAAQLRCAEALTRAHYPPRMLASSPPRDRHEKIRIAYLSGDLGEHAVTYLLAGVFERHDPGQFETIGLAWDRQSDGPARQRVERALTRFIDISAESDAAVVRLMRELEVDIAIDLTGHTLGQRTAILAERAAPLQVNYLGLPATMGAIYMDYLIADRFLIPPEHEQWYTEKVVCLEGSFQPNDDRRPAPPPTPPRTSFGLPEHGLVFCCFNRNAKLNPTVFEIWMQLLHRTPGSVLWLLATHAAAADNLRREAAARGVAPERLVFAAQVPYLDYLARYRHVDLFLDTSPFNGGATVSDALTMGVPVLTVAGASFAGRMAVCLLHNLGLSELVVSTLAEYEATALALAAEPGRLHALRQRLAQLRLDHPWFDTDRYRETLEGAYRRMWERHAAGLPPCSFVVPRRPAPPGP
jgi:predicted O-linked N-acetylglucosamine transferase (SPINDLY family)